MPRLRKERRTELSTIFYVAVSQGNGGLGAPKGRGRDAAGCTPEDDEPFDAVAVVDVQRGAVRCVTQSAQDQDPFHADLVRQSSKGEAKNRHQTAWSSGFRIPFKLVNFSLPD